MENQQKDTVGLQPTEPNTLYQKPTNRARKMPMEQNKREQFIIRRIGGTTYKVRVVFNENGGETIPSIGSLMKKLHKLSGAFLI